MEKKEKLEARNKATPPCTFRYRTARLQKRVVRAAAKDNRPIGFAINQALEDYCAKMGV